MIRIPQSWDPIKGARPIVFIHGLGAGLLGYNVLISEFTRLFSDRPILVPLQPHISQNLFHSRFLKPMTRHETVECLAGLLVELGWAVDCDEAGLPEQTQSGVTMISHSKYVFC